MATAGVIGNFVFLINLYILNNCCCKIFIFVVDFVHIKPYNKTVFNVDSISLARKKCLL